MRRTVGSYGAWYGEGDAGLIRFGLMWLAWPVGLARAAAEEGHDAANIGGFVQVFGFMEDGAAVCRRGGVAAERQVGVEIP